MVFVVRTGSPKSLELVLADDSGAITTTMNSQVGGTFRTKLPEGEYRVKVDVPGYTVKSLFYGNTDLLQNSLLKVSSTDAAQLEMTLAPSATSLLSVAGNAFDSLRLYVNTLNGPNGAAPTITLLDSVGLSGASSLPPTVHIGPDVAQSYLVTQVPPVYPSAARAAGVRDAIVVRAEIDKEGIVRNPVVESGHPLLNDVAIDAVKQWRYRPYLLNLQPTAVTTTITVDFGN